MVISTLSYYSFTLLFFQQASTTKLWALSELFQDMKCCGYMDAGLPELGFDCIVIPGLRKSIAPSTLIGDSVCGNGAGLVTIDDATESKTVCCKFLLLRLVLCYPSRILQTNFCSRIFIQLRIYHNKLMHKPWMLLLFNDIFKTI